jgi:hypothetical protein
MGGIMYYLEYEPDTMAPFLRGLIRRFLASRISNPDPPLTGNNSYSYLNSLGVESPTSTSDSSHSDNQQRTESEHIASVTYNLESIPGL